MLRLSSEQTANLQVPRHDVPLRHYLKQPRRLVHALMNPEQVDELSQDTFRFHLRGFQFLMLDIRPVVDLKIDVHEDHLKVRSVGCKILGNDYIDKQFSLDLKGQLNFREQESVTDLDGKVRLVIAVGLPPVLEATPHALLEKTGNQILRGVLMTIKQRLMKQLAADYEQWSHQQAQQESSSLSIGSSQTRPSCAKG